MHSSKRNNSNGGNRSSSGNWNNNYQYHQLPNQFPQMMNSNNHSFSTGVNNNHNDNGYPNENNFGYNGNVYPYMDFSMQPAPHFDPMMMPMTQQTQQLPHQSSQQHQQAYPMSSPATNGMLTPFDTAYGATLLPSHLLMGSPFISSPNMQTPQQMSQATFGRNRKSSGFNQFQQQQKYNNGNNSHLQNNGIGIISNSKLYKENVSDESIEFTEANIKKMESLFNVPFSVSYKILPKGDDVYRTRSLLLENIDKSINVHDFIANFVKSTEVESVYIIPNESNQSILLSFMTIQICLNFYNNVLQRLKEFKSAINSDDMSLNFIILKYNNKDDKTNNQTKLGEEDCNSMFKYDLEVQDATRSIAIELNNDYDEDKLNNLLKDINLDKDNDMNKRYIIESIAMFNTVRSNNSFPKNYVIITFLNVKMAEEMIYYLKYKSEKLDLGKCYFVVMTPSPVVKKKTDSDSQDNKSSSTPSLRNPSTVSLMSSKSSLNLNEDINDIIESLGNIHLKDNLLTIDTSLYSNYDIQNFTDHLSVITKSYSQLSSMGRSNSVMSTPRPLLDRTFNETPAFGPMDTNGFTPQNNILIPQTPMGITTPSFYMEQPPFKYNKHLPQPITDTLEDQMHTSAKVASAMGSDAANRTIYIGNINPRSRPEDVCNVVRGGILQNIKFIESKHICFITFIEASAAVQFYANTFIDPIVLHGNTLKIGWGNYSGALSKTIALAVTVGASRNVYVSLPEVAFKDKFINDPEFESYHKRYRLPSEEQLRKDFSSYGSIEQINYLGDSHCCWVNFMNINSAIKLVEDATNKIEQFSQTFDNRYDGLIINYGKDRCGNMNKNLVSKNSKFNKKMKKNNRNNNRLNQLEEKRRYQEINRKSFQRMPNGKPFGLNNMNNHHNNGHFDNGYAGSNNYLPLDSLGISIDTTANCQLSPIVDHEEEDEEDEDPDITLQQIANDDEEEETDEMEKVNTEAGISEISSDSDVVTQQYQRAQDKKEAFEDTRHHDVQHQEETGLGISTVGSNHSVSPSPETLKAREEITNDGNETFIHEHHGRNNKKRNDQHYNNVPKNGRTIPGSDVMAQYLAQLQHSTFMYAANVLGASNEQNELYSQDE